MNTAATETPSYMIAAQEIGRQLGRAKVMIGAKNMGGSKDDQGRPYLSFGIMRNTKKVTHIRITLEKNDTYTMQFIRVANYTHKIIAEVEMVYVDQLHAMIETHTGLRTSL